MKQNQKIKLLISYHKPDVLLKDSVLTPVHAGRARALHDKPEDDESLQWMLNHTIGDNTGDHISDQNNIFNEMTAVYWAWKNCEKIGNPDYIGFMHYRRHFIFNAKLKKAIYECQDMEGDYLDRICYNENNIKNIMKDCDFVCVKPQWRDSLYEQYKRNHEIEDLDTAIEILKEKYPQFASAADQYLSGHDAYFCNMFIFPRKIFFEYAAWFFDIAMELLRRVDFTYKRLFISEWLTGIFITYLLKKGKKGKFFPTIIAEGEHEIPVVLAADQGYAYPLTVAVASLLKNAAKNTAYRFYLLLSQDFPKEKTDIIEQLCRQHPRSSYQFINMGNAYSDAAITILHITKATYYRLKLPSILPNINKCIYLDADVVVNGDLSGLYRTCIDDRYIAGVRAFGYLQSDAKIADKLRELGIASMDQYVNAGVLLMNLEKMRRDHMEDMFEALLEKKFESQDQDILNAACYGKIRLLPFQYNVMTKYPVYSDCAYQNTPYFQRWIKKEEWDFGRKNPVIIHYADKKKPWSDMSSYYADKWWELLNCFESKTAVDIINCYKEELIQNAYETERLRKLMVAQRNDLRREMQRRTVFRVRNVLYIPKKIRGLIRCLNEHGIRYTVRECMSVLGLGKFL